MVQLLRLGNPYKKAYFFLMSALYQLQSDHISLYFDLYVYYF